MLVVTKFKELANGQKKGESGTLVNGQENVSSIDTQEGFDNAKAALLQVLNQLIGLHGKEVADEDHPLKVFKDLRTRITKDFTYEKVTSSNNRRCILISVRSFLADLLANDPETVKKWTAPDLQHLDQSLKQCWLGVHGAILTELPLREYTADHAIMVGLRDCLLQLATAFLKTQKEYSIGNERHNANHLYNAVREILGLPEIVDHYALDPRLYDDGTKEELFNRFNKYVEENLTEEVLIESIIFNNPLPNRFIDYHIIFDQDRQHDVILYSFQPPESDEMPEAQKHRVLRYVWGCYLKSKGICDSSAVSIEFPESKTVYVTPTEVVLFTINQSMCEQREFIGLKHFAELKASSPERWEKFKKALKRYPFSLQELPLKTLAQCLLEKPGAEPDAISDILSKEVAFILMCYKFAGIAVDSLYDKETREYLFSVFNVLEKSSDKCTIIEYLKEFKDTGKSQFNIMIYLQALMHHAAGYGQVEAIKVLVKELKADVNAACNNSITALHFVAANGQVGLYKHW